MTRITMTTPFMLGFENLDRMMTGLCKAGGESFPPYNVEQLDDVLRITLAVAGYALHDLDVSLEENQLIIRGRQEQADSNRTFIYRGIAGRNFVRSFMLVPGMQVSAAVLDKGLLHIDLLRPEPDKTVLKIDIQSIDKKESLK